jgi:hypothetical protein
MFKNRSTVDIVVILFALMIGTVLFLGTIGIIIGKVVHPEIDSTRATEMIAGVVTTIVGALVGFVGGRAVGRTEANGAT